MVLRICSATVPSRVSVNPQPSAPDVVRIRTTTNSRCFMIQSPKITGSGNCPWIVATAISEMICG
jgi:hypothetical protein